MTTTANETIYTLIAGRPGRMRNSLLAFLQAIPGVEVISLVDDPDMALEVARRERPTVLVVDADLSEASILALVRQIQAELPALNIVVLVNSLQQQHAFLAAGANHALLKGLLDERLREAVLRSETTLNDEC